MSVVKLGTENVYAACSALASNSGSGFPLRLNHWEVMILADDPCILTVKILREGWISTLDS